LDPGKVEVFDSTTITLFKEILKGAGRNPLEGDKKGGVKVFAKIILHRVGVLSGKHKKTPY